MKEKRANHTQKNTKFLFVTTFTLKKIGKQMNGKDKKSVEQMQGKFLIEFNRNADYNKY